MRSGGSRARSAATACLRFPCRGPADMCHSSSAVPHRSPCFLFLGLQSKAVLDMGLAQNESSSTSRCPATAVRQAQCVASSRKPSAIRAIKRKRSDLQRASHTYTSLSFSRSSRALSTLNPQCRAIFQRTNKFHRWSKRPHSATRAILLFKPP